jgi:glutaredoxin 3
VSLEPVNAPSSETAPARVVLYTLATCGACVHARGLLERRGIVFEEVALQDLPGGRDALFELTGGFTVPQVVIDGDPIGGADALARLDRRGALTALVRRAPFPRAVIRRRLSLSRLLAALASLLDGDRRGPWRYEVVLMDRDGVTLERRRSSSAVAAAQLADALNGR